MLFGYADGLYPHSLYKTREQRKGDYKGDDLQFFSFPDYSFISKDRTLLRILKKIVEKGKQENQLRDDIPSDHYVEELIVALLGAETLWCFDETGRSLVDIVDNAVRLTMKGISKPEQRDGARQIHKSAGSL